MDTTLQDPFVGRVLDGRYRVGQRVARGGMATVYRAVDTRLDRAVALKIMHPGLAEDEGFVDRFIREAKAAARLSHPNVVAVFDQGRDDHSVFLAMEFIEGRTLRDLMREHGRLTPRQAFEVLEPVLAALGAAHAAGLVHRDVKPENVLLADDGRVKVADFGLARAVSATSTHTATAGVLIGTVAYLSPEQVENGVSDQRSDVYAVGILLYEMLTGRKPFDGDSPIQVAFAHVHDDVAAPSELVPDLPAEVDALVMRATGRDPARRPADATVLLAELRRTQASLSESELDAGGPVTEVTDDTEIITTGVRPNGSHPEGSDRTVVVRRTEPTTIQPRPTVPPTATSRAASAAPRSPGGPTSARRRRNGLVALVLVLLLAAGLSVGAWWIGAGPGAYTSTPPVIELSQAQAEAKLAAAGLKVAYADPAFSETLAKGLVLASDPDPNARIRKGDTVTLTLSAGKERYAVPNLVGQTEAAARAALAEANLTVGKVTTAYDDKVAKGKVVSQGSEVGAQLKRDTAVNFVLSKGPPPVQIPDLRGESLEDATAALAKIGLVAKVGERQFSDDIAKDAVISQAPASGTALKGSTVTLVVSKGPDLVDVPDVTGKKVNDARKTLEKAGFKVDILRAPFGPGKVYSQNPGGGQAKRGSTVTLYVV